MSITLPGSWFLWHSLIVPRLQASLLMPKSLSLSWFCSSATVQWLEEGMCQVASPALRPGRGARWERLCLSKDKDSQQC